MHRICCHNCGYDLSSLFAKQTQFITCPECGSFVSATPPAVRTRPLSWGSIAWSCLPTAVVIPLVYLAVIRLYSNLEVAVAIGVGFCVGLVSSFIAAAVAATTDQKFRIDLGASRNWEYAFADWIAAFGVFGGANFLVLILAMLLLAGLGR